MRFLCVLLLFFTCQAHALYTELGINYGKKKTTFDADNYTNTESLTGSLSFYFFERLALELSYTNAISVQQERTVSGTTVISQTTIVQTTEAYGGDLIWVFADKKTFFQPYVKGGVAHLHRVQEVKINSLQTYTLAPDNTVVPSYGFGFKLAITETFGFKISYDAWKTPISGGSTTLDDSVRAGVTWIF